MEKDEFEDADYAGGMTERNLESARGLLSDKKLLGTAEKSPEIEGLPAPETAAKDMLRVPEESNDSIMSEASSALEKEFAPVKLDPKELINNAIKASEMPVKITWDNLKFSARVEDKDKKKCCSSAMKELNILKGCSGSAMPGQATYIMGSSGAGKTSLLNLISDRVSQGRGNKIEGTVTLNDSKKLD